MESGRTTDERGAQAPIGELAFAGLGIGLQHRPGTLAGGIPSLGQSINAAVTHAWKIGFGWLGMGTALKLAVGILGFNAQVNLVTVNIKRKIKVMKHKTLNIPVDCVGAVQAALRVKIVYLQSYREDSIRRGYLPTAEAIMIDIANLTMVADKLDEAVEH